MTAQDGDAPGTPRADDLVARKEALRRRMRAVRASIEVPERERRAAEVRARLLELPQVAAAGVVLLFYAFGSEIATDELLLDLLELDKRPLLPYLDASGMEAAEVRAGELLVPSDYGPREPQLRRAVPPAAVDLVIAPGLAFDPRGYRLGYGGGHYDRYLTRLRPDAVRVGIGFDEQLLDAVPSGPDDERLDVVVTDRRVVAATGEA